MNNATWNDLKGKVMAVHGPNIDWWGVRIAVNKYLFARQIPDDSGVDAFNTVYEVTHLPYRKNNPDGSPTVKVSGWVKTTRGDHRLFSRG